MVGFKSDRIEFKLTITWLKHEWVYTFMISRRFAELINKIAFKLKDLPFVTYIEPIYIED